jgi:hypothetical protein
VVRNVEAVPTFIELSDSQGRNKSLKAVGVVIRAMRISRASSTCSHIIVISYSAFLYSLDIIKATMRKIHGNFRVIKYFSSTYSFGKSYRVKLEVTF